MSRVLSGVEFRFTVRGRRRTRVWNEQEPSFAVVVSSPASSSSRVERHPSRPRFRDDGAKFGPGSFSVETTMPMTTTLASRLRGDTSRGARRSIRQRRSHYYRDDVCCFRSKKSLFFFFFFSREEKRVRAFLRGNKSRERERDVECIIKICVPSSLV